jgi:hypothetical protein
LWDKSPEDPRRGAQHAQAGIAFTATQRLISPLGA